MSEGAVGMLVLVGISVAVPLIGHSLSTRYLPTSVLSGVISITAFLAIVLLRGDRDPFIAIAAVVGGGLAVLIALLVGLPFIFRRTQKRERTGQQ